MPGAKEAKGMVCEKARGNALDANGAGSASECPRGTRILPIFCSHWHVSPRGRSLCSLPNARCGACVPVKEIYCHSSREGSTFQGMVSWWAQVLEHIFGSKTAGPKCWVAPGPL